MKKFIFTTLAVALVCSAGMFSSCSKSDEDDNKNEETYNPSVDGIVGEWYSAGTDVAPLLVAYNDSLYAKFNSDGTYLVEQYKDGAKGTNLVGVYEQEKSSVGNIWTIHLEQTTPTVLATEGIFEVTKVGNKYTMKYEVVQTGTVFAPPTPAGGFGSTGGLTDYGLAADANVQKYVRIEK
jgi:hypothetical protein